MDAETVARNFALIRVVIGTAFAAAPERSVRSWIGPDAGRPGAQLVTRGLGARDVAIGLGTLRALRQGDSPGPWTVAALLSDAIDLVATLAVAGSLPRSARLVGVGMTGGSTLLGLWLARKLG